MTDWFRRKSWTKIDEEQYFKKLNRARNDSRPQYLKIQAIELVETKDPKLLDNLPLHPVMQKWWKYMADIMETNPDNSPVQLPLEEVFYLP